MPQPSTTIKNKTPPGFKTRVLGPIGTFLRSQIFISPPSPTASFAGKTVIVTGSNAGLGLEAARHIYRLGASLLILAVRNRKKGLNAKEWILASCPDRSPQGKSAGIEIWDLDLSSYASVKAFAAKALGLERLDVLLENAGVMTTQWTTDKETCVLGGQQTVEFEDERQLKVNVLSTGLLAALLLPKLQETSRKFGVRTNLGFVTSEMYQMAQFKEMSFMGQKRQGGILGAMNDEKRSDNQDRYPVTKLLEIMIVREMVRRLNQIKGDGLTHQNGSENRSQKQDCDSDSENSVVITLVNPGFCISEFTRDLSGFEFYAHRTMSFLIGRKTEVGSRNLVLGVAAGKDSHGQYMSDGANQELGWWLKSVEGEDVQRAVFEEVMERLDQIENGCAGNLGWDRNEEAGVSSRVY
jgi:retinol dehydrogenase 12